MTKKSGRTARVATPAQTTFVSVTRSDVAVEQFIEMVKSLKLPRVTIPQGTGRAQYIMPDRIIGVTQTREDIPDWPYTATQNGITFPTLWKLHFVPIDQILVEEN